MQLQNNRLVLLICMLDTHIITTYIKREQKLAFTSNFYNLILRWKFQCFLITEGHTAEHQHNAHTSGSYENSQRLASQGAVCKPPHRSNQTFIRTSNTTFWSSVHPVFYLINSYVSPSNGLNGFPVRSHCEATADTANAATHCSKEYEYTAHLLDFSLYQTITAVTVLQNVSSQVV